MANVEITPLMLACQKADHELVRSLLVNEVKFLLQFSSIISIRLTFFETRQSCQLKLLIQRIAQRCFIVLNIKIRNASIFYSEKDMRI